LSETTALDNGNDTLEQVGQPLASPSMLATEVLIPRQFEALVNLNSSVVNWIMALDPTMPVVPSSPSVRRDSGDRLPSASTCAGWTKTPRSSCCAFGVNVGVLIFDIVIGYDIERWSSERRNRSAVHGEEGHSLERIPEERLTQGGI